ncbi:hypothetical protein AB0J28_18520 [Streptosporangium canum]|uniref:hypothetical protein n=1 Tax=Streptosporangium canum TaxID=324952 RepID=UPI003422D062
MSDYLIRGALIVVFTIAVLRAWRLLHPTSFWLLLGFPAKAITVYFTWRAVASGCGLSRRRRKVRWTFPTFPGLGR